MDMETGLLVKDVVEHVIKSRLPPDHVPELGRGGEDLFLDGHFDRLLNIVHGRMKKVVYSVGEYAIVYRLNALRSCSKTALDSELSLPLGELEDWDCDAARLVGVGYRIAGAGCMMWRPVAAVVGLDRASKRVFVHPLPHGVSVLLWLLDPVESEMDVRQLMGFDVQPWEAETLPEAGRVRLQGDLVLDIMRSWDDGEEALRLASWIIASEREAGRALQGVASAMNKAASLLAGGIALPWSDSYEQVVENLLAAVFSEEMGDDNPEGYYADMAFESRLPQRLGGLVVVNVESPYTPPHESLVDMFTEGMDFVLDEEPVASCIADPLSDVCLEALPSLAVASVVIEACARECPEDYSLAVLPGEFTASDKYTVTLRLREEEVLTLIMRLATIKARVSYAGLVERERPRPVVLEAGEHRVWISDAILLRTPLVARTFFHWRLISALHQLAETLREVLAGRRLTYRRALRLKKRSPLAVRQLVGSLLRVLHTPHSDRLVLIAPGARVVVSHEEHGSQEFTAQKYLLAQLSSLPVLA